MAVERDLFAKDGSVAAERALPESMADDHAGRPATTLVFARRKIEGRCPPGEDAGKRLMPLPNLFPKRIGQFRTPPIVVPRITAWLRDVRLGEFLRFMHGQRPQTHRVQQLEDRRVRADA